MATETVFDFEGEFAMLDIGVTSTLIRSGTVRPTVIAYASSADMESVVLDWSGAEGVSGAFEEARRFLREREPAAYAVVAEIAVENGQPRFLLPHEAPPLAGDYLALTMTADDGFGRGLRYPVSRTGGKPAFGMPIVTDGLSTDWCPIGDVWRNPFCVGDVVRFHVRDRVVDPTTPLWQTIVELTRLRIHEDQPNAEEYMSFLDDLRNGIFVVAGRPSADSGAVHLRPRTVFNPLGTLTVEASRLTLVEGPEADVVPVVR